MLSIPDASTRRALMWIISACAMAHIWCLGSQFYLDDLVQIRDAETIRNLQSLKMGTHVWTSFWYVVQAGIFGMSPVGFHVVNWLLHTSIACVLYVSGRDYLRGTAPEGVALFAAVLFGVHPLASEIPNYARTQDLAWVTLFSMLAAWLLFRALQGNTRRNLLGTAVCIAGASISKGPGFMHASMMTAVIGLAFMRPEHWQFVRKHVLLGGVLAVLGLAAIWQSGMLKLAAEWSEPRVIGHAYTLCRVFWEYVARSVLPINLSADHHIAETLVPPGTIFGIADTTALWSLLGIAVFTGVALVLAWRKPTRMLGVCACLFVGTILMRFLFFIPEFMPEYRIYPGLPWFSLGCALILAGAWQVLVRGSGRIAAVLLVMLLAGMSAKRAFLYHDINGLMADVLKQYPGQARAVWIMQKNAMDAGRWQNVIVRHRELLPQVRQAFMRENNRLAPARELPTGHFALAEIGCMGLYANAMAKQVSPTAGMVEINRMEAYMQALRLDPTAHAIHWSLFHQAKGLVLETTGDYQAAADFLAMDKPAADRKIDLQRVREKLKHAQPDPVSE
jgi:hypothetical protein